VNDPALTRIFLGALMVITLSSLAAGVVLVLKGYASAGPFAVASACVGVLGTLAAGARRNGK
jgi:hypothetical protein